MSFTNAPVSRSLVVGLVGTSVAATLFDVKHYFYIFADSHIWHYRQLWRAFTYQLCFMNSSEVLFACMAIYNLRVVERMWGSRKFAVSRISLFTHGPALPYPFPSPWTLFIHFFPLFLSSD